VQQESFASTVNR